MRVEPEKTFWRDWMSKKKADRNDLDIITKQGIVTKVFNKQVEVLIEEETINCIIPTTYLISKNSIGVGERVEVAILGSKQYKLMKTLNRETSVYRGNRKVLGEDILIATNMDQMIVLVTTDYLLNQTGYIEEAVIAASRAQIGVALYISKWDMANEQVQHLLSDKIELYRSMTDHVFIGSCDSIDESLLEYLSRKSTVFVGDRACGKSTLIRRICCQAEGRALEGKIPSTNAVELVCCKDMKLIDTPGFREFALQKIHGTELEYVFHEITEHEKRCEFRNCSHTHEENCSVLEALQKKEIRRERYLAYQKMKGTVTENIVKVDYRHNPCNESFVCKSCGKMIVPEGAGTQHRNHCPYCLCSVHVDHDPGDRASLCHGIMHPIGVWVRNDGEWAIIHRCKSCGALSSNRIAADDSPILLMSIAVKPLSRPPFPLDKFDMKI